MTPKPVIAVTLNSQELPRMIHWRRMFEGLQAFGAVPLAIDCGSTLLDFDGLLNNVDGLLLSGGGDVDPMLYGGDPTDPTLTWVNRIRDANETAAFEAAWAHGVPTLAICRGAQLVNVLRGGTLYADVSRDYSSAIAHRLGEEALISLAHTVDIATGTRLARWLATNGQTGVNSQHHQGIRSLAAEFTATAHAPDGLIEAFESSERPVTAVQWHPEINWDSDDSSRRLLRAFVASTERLAAGTHARCVGHDGWAANNTHT